MTIQDISELLDKKLEPILQRLDRIEADVATLKVDVAGLQTDMREVKDNVRKILLFIPIGNEDVILKLAKH